MKRIVMLVVLAVVGWMGVVAPSAEAGAHDAVIRNSGYSTMLVCHNWGKTTCADKYWRYLHPGKNTLTQFGWTDADGYRIKKGCRVNHIEATRGNIDVKVYGQYGATVDVPYMCR